MSSELPEFYIRRIRPEDRALLVLGLKELSDENRYYRFHMARSQFAEHELDYLTNCDDTDHIARLALIEEKGVGVARFYRDPECPEWGEVAVVVIDSWHRRGVASALLAALAARCREVGVIGWRATIMGENLAALDLFAKCGTTVARSWDSRCVTLEIELP